MELLKKYWKWIVGFIALAIALYLFYAYSKKAGVKTVLSDIPNTPGSVPLTDAERTTIRTLTNRLIADINAWTGGLDRDGDLYASLKGATDRILVGVANQYKEDTQADLIADLQNEWAANPIIVDNTRIILERLKKLLNQ